MNIRLQDRAAILLKNYWQVAILVILGIVIMGQAASAGWRALELRQIDRMIVQAETLQPTQESESQSSQGFGPGARSESNEAQARGRGGGGMASDRQPAKNIFRREQTNYQLTGVYMNKAVINNREVSVGDRVGQAEVVEITPFSVVIREDGSDRTQTLAMFTGGASSSAPGARGAAGARGVGGFNVGARGGAPTGGTQRQGAPAERATGGGAPAGGFGGFGGFDAGMSREDMRARFEAMSPQEREQMRNEMQQRFGGMGGGMGGPGGGMGGRGGMGGPGGRGGGG